MNDTDKLREILRSFEWINDGWISQAEILSQCRYRFKHGMTVHSRVSDLRKRGYDVQNRLERRNGRVISYYRLVTP
jgi:hypothetical protein